MRNPLMTAFRAEAANILRSWCSTRRTKQGWLALAAIAVALGVVVPLVGQGLPQLLRVIAPHLMTINILVAVQASVLVHNGRRKWTEIYARNWLSTLPVSRRQTLGAIAARVFAGPLLVLALLSSAVLIATLSERGLGAVVSPFLVGIGMATVAGSLLGWCMPRRETGVPSPTGPSLTASTPSNAPTLAALSQWTLLQAKATLQPRSLARLLLPLALLLPLEITGNVAVVLLVVWGLVLYLVILLRALVHVAQRGAVWLKPTPTTFARYAWAVACVPMLRQLQWTVVTAGLLVAVGCKPVVALRAAEWWLSLVTLTSTLALAQAYRARALRYRLIVSVAILAVAEHLREHLALPCAMLISAGQLKRASRS
jgi:hypothetical protein